MTIPKEFKCAGFTIKVTIVDSLPDNEYGNFCDATNEIKIARTMKVEDKVVELTKEQLLNTYLHELWHCFQFYFDNSYSEAQAQTYANFMCEYLRSTTV